MEDDPADAALIATRIEGIAHSEVVPTVGEALRRLTSSPPPAVVVLDYGLQDLPAEVVIDLVAGHDWPIGARPLVLLMTGYQEGVPDAVQRRVDAVGSKVSSMEELRSLL